MNIDTIAFSKGFLRIKERDSYEDEAVQNYFDSLDCLNPIVLNMQVELMRYGYMFDKACLFYLDLMDDETLISIADSLADYLADAYGDGCYVSLFGNYPTSVLMMSETEMFIHQIVHYLSDGAYSPAMPSCDDQELLMLHDKYDGVVLRDSYKLIHTITNKEFCDYFKKLLSSQQSLTSYDKDVIAYVLKNSYEIANSVNEIIPEEIPFKETLCIVFANVDSYYPKTVTDVLRYAVYLSGGDVSLPKIPTALDYGWSNLQFDRMSQYLKDYYEKQLTAARAPFKFKKFSRPERRKILDMIEHLFTEEKKKGKRGDNILADMKKYAERWIRLGEILHPGEYANRYPETAEAFTTLRIASQYISTYYSRVEAARKADDYELLISIYCERPGEFARNIDNLLRNYPSHYQYTLDKFAEVLSSISTKMIYELLDHFNVRNDIDFRDGRYVVIKGARKPSFKLPLLPELSYNVISYLLKVLVTELNNRFSKLDSLEGKTYILDESIKNIALPKNMRSMNFMPGQLARGSKLPIDISTGILRCYCRWTDKFGQYDLDLSTSMYDSKFNYLTSISWNTYYKREKWAVFSGDVRHRKGNCAEYIDVDIKGARNAGVRYIVASVNDFDGQGFAKKDAWAGIMERSEFGTPGEVTWAPSTVTTGFRLTSVCTNIIMTIIDIKDMVMYVVDEDYSGIPVASASARLTGDYVKRYVNAKRYFNGYSLIDFNITSRNGSVYSVEHDKIDDIKKSLADNKAQYLSLKKKYEDELANLPESTDVDRISKRNELYKNLEELNKYLEKLNNTEVIEYNDIASDYTKLLNWMF